MDRAYVVDRSNPTGTPEYLIQEPLNPPHMEMYDIQYNFIPSSLYFMLDSSRLNLALISGLS